MKEDINYHQEKFLKQFQDVKELQSQHTENFQMLSDIGLLSSTYIKSKFIQSWKNYPGTEVLKILLQTTFTLLIWLLIKFINKHWKNYRKKTVRIPSTENVNFEERIPQSPIENIELEEIPSTRTQAATSQSVPIALNQKLKLPPFKNGEDVQPATK